MDNAGNTNPNPNPNPNANCCCLMKNLPAAGSGDGPAPCQPTKLFRRLFAENLPRLEDETPPCSFYEVLENAETAFHCARRVKVLVSLDAQTLQRSIATQTQRWGQAHIQAETQTETPSVHAITQTHRQTDAQSDNQTQTYSNDLRLEQELQPFIQRRSLWSLLKTLLLLIWLLHSCYVMCRCLNRLPVLRHLTAPPLPPPPPPPSPPRTLPAFIWVQLSRLARKLHII